MKKIDNIEQLDDLLKQQFDSYAPEPPAEVWQSISQQQIIGNSSTVTSKFVSTLKSVSMLTKVIITIASIVASSIAVVVLQEDKSTQTAHTVQTQIHRPEIQDNTEKYANTNQLESIEKQSSSPNQPKPAKPTSSDMVISSTPKEEPTYTPKTPSLEESSDLKSEVKPQVIESQHNQTDPDKSAVKSNVNEITIYKETETINQSNKIALSDTDTLNTPDIPNTFTPGDDDNLNKEFVIKIDNENLYRLRVFDTKANLVFESFKKELRWNGQHFKTGENCESGKYFYIFDYQYKGAKELRQKSGYIFLTR